MSTNKIEIKDGLVFQGETQIATIEGNVVRSDEALSRVMKGQINKEFGEKCDFQLTSGADDSDETEEDEKPGKSKASKGDPEPAKDPSAGDLTPAYIEWHRKNKSKEEHEARYGKDESRLTSGNHVLPPRMKPEAAPESK
jgi:hypothetical protein